MAGGQHPSQALYNAFADPRTGEYNVAAVGQFLAQAETNAQAQQAWAQLNEQARMEREIAKFFRADQGRCICQCTRSRERCEWGQQYLFRKWAGKKYSAVPDSLIREVRRHQGILQQP